MTVSSSVYMPDPTHNPDDAGDAITLVPCTDEIRSEQLTRIADIEIGFLNCDPRVEPVAAMIARLDAMQAILFIAVPTSGQGDPVGLVGFAPNPRQTTQWAIDVVPAAPGIAVRLILVATEFAQMYLAARSVVRVGQIRDGRHEYFPAAGFRELGKLRKSLYEDGAYRDQPVWWRATGREGDPR
jgi:hypothetical protein